MGREERQKESMRQALWERTVGDVRPFGVFANGCPKCGAAQAAVNWCPGNQVLLDESADQPCPFIGQHLHRQCSACSFVWLEKCLDDDETPAEIRVRVNPSATLAAILLRLDGKAEIPVAEIEAALRHRIGAVVSDGIVHVVAVAP